MTKHEAAREIIRQNGDCINIDCLECPLHDGNCNIEDTVAPDRDTRFRTWADRARAWLAANPTEPEPGEALSEGYSHAIAYLAKSKTIAGESVALISYLWDVTPDQIYADFAKARKEGIC